MTPYFPAVHNSWIEYIFLGFEGTYNPVDGTISVDGNTRRPKPSYWTTNEYMRTTCLVDPNDAIPCVRRVNTELHQPPAPDMLYAGKCLYNGPWRLPGQPGYIGEIGAPGFTALPPPPILTINPVAGETFEVLVDFITHGDLTMRGECPARYRTTWVGQPWGQYPDTVRTALQERPDGPDSIVYNYVFARDIGLVDSWWGLKEADNSLRFDTAWQLYALGNG